jgi:hypothetical protein
VLFHFNERGGRITVPPPGAGSNYGLTVRYAAPELTYHDPGGMSSCAPDGSTGPPIQPVGFTLDWFGQAFAAEALGFASADLHGEITSDTWRSRRQYYLYGYTQYCDVGMCEYQSFSYEIGPLRKKDNRLSFSSPFESPYGIGGNGIAVLLEIVHRTPKIVHSPL